MGVLRIFNPRETWPKWKETPKERLVSQIKEVLKKKKRDKPDHEILGVGANADAEEVESAFKRLTKTFHPDVVGAIEGIKTKDISDAEEAFRIIVEARGNLKKVMRPRQRE